MNFLAGLIIQLLHAVLMLAAAPLVVGGVRWIKARLLGRQGAPLLQPLWDFRRKLRKQPVVAENASFLFLHAPTACLAATGAAVLLVPSFAQGMASAKLADLVVIAGLLSLARVTLALAAMDVGTAFGGLGASRAMSFAVFAEPALLLVFLTLALLAGTTSLDAVVALLRDGALGLRVSLGLVLIVMIMVALAENGRLPVDNPAAHLELTMVHEAMLLEYSGRHLAMLELAAALRLVLWLTLLGTIFAPLGLAPVGAGPLAWLVGLVAWGAKTALLCVALAVFEVVVAKMRVFRVPEFLGVALLLGLLAALFLFVSTGFE
jgi:formate hydrogenlyase subunit 4